LTEQGTQAYQGRQFVEAKNYFSQAVAAAPQSGQAHYNYAIALYSLGDTEEARQHFLEAANLAPGDKTIWDSPPLHQYGNPQSEKAYKEHPTTTSRPTFGGGPR
jgi:Flp pilus assembly protein TadD